MPLPAKDEQVLYGRVLEEIKGRLAAATTFLTFPLKDGRATLNTHDANCAAMHLRMCLEFVALGSLVANRPEVEQVTRAFAKHDADAAAKIVKRLNPDYWPVPLRLVIPEDGSQWRLERVADGYLRETEWRAEWGFLSSLLHAANPYKQTPSQPPPNLVQTVNRLGRIHRQLQTLLSRHQVTLVDCNVVLTALMHAKEDGRVHVQGAVRVDPV
jgi:hypothetical protein